MKRHTRLYRSLLTACLGLLLLASALGTSSAPLSVSAEEAAATPTPTPTATPPGIECENELCT